MNLLRTAATTSTPHDAGCAPSNALPYDNRKKI